jgi:predicted nucleotidyltransferase
VPHEQNRFTHGIIAEGGCSYAALKGGEIGGSGKAIRKIRKPKKTKPCYDGNMNTGTTTTTPKTHEDKSYLPQLSDNSPKHPTLLTHKQIAKAVIPLIEKYKISKASYFGSYANGNATEESDLDILVEFTTPSVPFDRMIQIKLDLEEVLLTKVDVIHAPIPQDSILIIEKTVLIYEN